MSREIRSGGVKGLLLAHGEKIGIGLVVVMVMVLLMAAI